MAKLYIPITDGDTGEKYLVKVEPLKLFEVYGRPAFVSHYFRNQKYKGLIRKSEKQTRYIAVDLWTGFRICFSDSVDGAHAQALIKYEHGEKENVDYSISQAEKWVVDNGFTFPINRT